MIVQRRIRGIFEQNLQALLVLISMEPGLHMEPKNEMNEENIGRKRDQKTKAVRCSATDGTRWHHDGYRHTGHILAEKLRHFHPWKVPVCGYGSGQGAELWKLCLESDGAAGTLPERCV